MVNYYHIMSMLGGVQMPSLSESIIVNVDAGNIETYLRQKGFCRTDEEKGQELRYWVDKLFQTKKVDTNDFEEFLFGELFWGKRKSIRIYKLDTVRNIKYPEDWIERLQEKYGVESLNFRNVLGTIVNSSETRKIAAISSEENYKGELRRLRILFVLFAQIDKGRSLMDTTSYIPVEIDFENKLMIIKAWNRNGLNEDYRPDELMEHVRKILALSFKVTTDYYGISHKKVLFRMSQGLIDEIYGKIPAFNKIPALEEQIREFEQNVYWSLPLKHASGEEGKTSLKAGVLDFADEMHKLIEKLVVSDYFYDMPYEAVWKMGIDTIISRIRFNDVEHVLTSLSGEESEMPVFCTKTFMSLKKSMEDAELVERLWIAKDRTRGKLSLKYDATKDEYLGILILSNIRFKQEDLVAAMEIYKKYESENNEQVTGENQRDVI